MEVVKKRYMTSELDVKGGIYNAMLGLGTEVTYQNAPVRNHPLSGSGLDQRRIIDSSSHLLYIPLYPLALCIPFNLWSKSVIAFHLFIVRTSL